MLGKFGEAARLAAAVGEAVGRVAMTHGMDIGERLWGKVPDLKTATAMVQKFNLNRTPIPVKVSCVQNGSGPDDYRLLVDIDEIAAALNEERVAVPEITIYARFPDQLDRDLLADRLEKALQPLLDEYKAQIERRKAKVIAKRKKAESDAFWSGLGEAFDLSFIVVLFPPAILLLLAVSFAEFVSQLPALILAYFKGDELDKLDAEMALARATIKKVVRKMRIEQLP